MCFINANKRRSMYLVGMPSSVFALLKQNSDTENTCADYSPLEYCAQVFPVSEILYKLPCPYHGGGEPFISNCMPTLFPALL